MKSLNEMREAIALRYMRDDQYEQVKCDGEEILVRRYAQNDFIRLGRVEDVFAQMLERDADPTPYCTACGAQKKIQCQCPPIAENE